MKALIKVLMLIVLLHWSHVSYAAEKNITATVTVNKPLGTTGVGQEGEATATVTVVALEGNPNTAAEGAKFTYTWSLLSAEYRESPNPTAWTNLNPPETTVPNEDEPINTITTNFGVAGYYRVRFRVVVEFTLGTGDEKWKSPPIDTDIEQIVIGGDFAENGNKVLLFFCGAPTSSVVSIEGPLQPEGTTWSWLTSTGVAVTEDAGSPLPDGEVKGIQATSPGTAGNIGATIGSEWVQITYTLNGATWTSTRHTGYTVRKPTNLFWSMAEHGGAIDPVRGTFYLSKITWYVLDQFGVPMPNAPLHETFGAFQSSATYPNENWPPPTAWQGFTDTEGKFSDDLYIFDTGNRSPSVQIPDPNNLGNGLVQSGAQSYYVGSQQQGQGCLMKSGTLKYYLDHANHE